MNTSLRSVGLVSISAVALLLVGCVTSESERYEQFAPARAEHRPTTYALVLEFEGDAPTPEALAAVRARFGAYFNKQGCTLVDDLALADFLVRITLAHEDPSNRSEWSVVNSVTERNASAEGVSAGYAEAPPVFVSHSYAGTYGDWADDRYSGYPYFDDFGWAPLFGGIVVIAPRHPHHERRPVRPATAPIPHPPVKPANDHRGPPSGAEADRNGPARPQPPAGLVPGDEHARPGTPGRDHERETNRPSPGSRPAAHPEHPAPAGPAVGPHPPTNPSTPRPAPGPRVPEVRTPVPGTPAHSPDRPPRQSGVNPGTAAPTPHPVLPPPTPASGDKGHGRPAAGESSSHDGRFQPRPPAANPAPTNSPSRTPVPADRPAPRVSPPTNPPQTRTPAAPPQTHAPTRPANPEVHPSPPPSAARQNPTPKVAPTPRVAPPAPERVKPNDPVKEREEK